MKEFVKKCPFVFALMLSGFLVFDFYIVKNDYLKIMPDADMQAFASKSEGKVVDEKESSYVLDEMTQEGALDICQDPLLQGNSDSNTDDNSVSRNDSDGNEANGNEISESKTEGSAGQQDGKNQGSLEEQQNADGQQKSEEPYVGVTEFLTYEPSDVKSPYFKDPGKKALTTTYPYETVDASYFEDVAFIGDSRTIGLFDYAGFEGADFYADNGFCAYLWKKKGQVTLQNIHQKVVLEDALGQKQYGKIYLMVGMNDCGYGTTETFRETLEEMLQMIEDRQPNAIIFLTAIMNVTKEKEEQQDLFTKVHINAKNVAIAECANGINRFYLDYNDLYEDEEGYLRASDSFDGVHLYGNKYGPWIQFFLEHGIVKGETADGGEGKYSNQ